MPLATITETFSSRKSQVQGVSNYQVFGDPLQLLWLPMQKNGKAAGAREIRKFTLRIEGKAKGCHQR